MRKWNECFFFIVSLGNFTNIENVIKEMPSNLFQFLSKKVAEEKTNSSIQLGLNFVMGRKMARKKKVNI